MKFISCSYDECAILYRTSISYFSSLTLTTVYFPFSYETMRLFLRLVCLWATTKNLVNPIFRIIVPDIDALFLGGKKVISRTFSDICSPPPLCQLSEGCEYKVIFQLSSSKPIETNFRRNAFSNIFPFAKVRMHFTDEILKHTWFKRGVLAWLLLQKFICKIMEWCFFFGYLKTMPLSPKKFAEKMATSNKNFRSLMTTRRI